MAETDKNKTMQLDDVAREMKLSTSTVSRVISGKGHISEETRKRVLKFISEHNYQPNAIARSLATSRTRNIGVVIPGDAFLHITPFFQVCLMGICEKAVKLDYDVVVTSATETEISYLQRLVTKRAVDGVVLMRSLVKDMPSEYLKQTDLPFITIGSMEDKTVAQVDIKHKQAATDLVGTLLRNTDKPIGIVLGGMDYIVNLNRYRGYVQAFSDAGKQLDEDIIKKDLTSYEEISDAVDYLADKVGTLICGDDNICLTALARLAAKKKKIPSDIQLASLYDSAVLSNRDKPITAVEADDKALGAIAAQKLIEMIEGTSTVNSIELGYNISYRASTENDKL